MACGREDWAAHEAVILPSGRRGTADRVGAMVEIMVTRLDPDVPLPAYAHPGDAGADLTTTVDVTLGPGERAMVPTGIGDRAARGLRRAGAPALGAGRAARPVDRQRARDRRRGLPRRGQGDAGQPRPPRAGRPCAAATGSPSWSSSRSSGPRFVEVERCPTPSAARAGTVPPAVSRPPTRSRGRTAHDACPGNERGDAVRFGRRSPTSPRPPRRWAPRVPPTPARRARTRRRPATCGPTGPGTPPS